MLAGISVYVPACRQRKSIEGLIAQHGGCATRKWSPAVLSVKPDEAGASEARLWCVSDFKRYLDCGGHWTPGDEYAERPNHKASPSGQVRQAYTRDEDRKMIDFATSHETLSATGKLLWQEAEKLKVCRCKVAQLHVKQQNRSRATHGRACRPVGERFSSTVYVLSDWQAPAFSNLPRLHHPLPQAIALGPNGARRSASALCLTPKAKSATPPLPI